MLVCVAPVVRPSELVCVRRAQAADQQGSRFGFRGTGVHACERGPGALMTRHAVDVAAASAAPLAAATFAPHHERLVPSPRSCFP